MRKEKIVLFLNCNITNMNYYSPLFGLFFEQLFSEIFKSIPQAKDNDLYLLIDELSSIPLPSLSNVIANARKVYVHTWRTSERKPAVRELWSVQCQKYS